MTGYVEVVCAGGAPGKDFYWGYAVDVIVGADVVAPGKRVGEVEGLKELTVCPDFCEWIDRALVSSTTKLWKTEVCCVSVFVGGGLCDLVDEVWGSVEVVDYLVRFASVRREVSADDVITACFA
jgi:hypothetical protein